QVVLVEVEERVGGEGDLLADRGRRRRGRRGRCHRRRCGRGRRRGRRGRRRDGLQRAVAIGVSGGRGPVGVAPAQLIGAVLPGNAGGVDPVVDRLGLGVLF